MSGAERMIGKSATKACYQFLCLGHQHGAEQLGVGVFQRLPHPDVEEIGQICIADVIIVRRISGYHDIP